MLPPGTGFSKAQSHATQRQCDPGLAGQRERRESLNVDGAHPGYRSPIMRHRLHLSALVAMSLIGATTSVFAQGTGPAAGAQIGTVPGTGGMPPVSTTPTNPGSAGISSVPGSLPTTTTGIGSGTGSDSSTDLNTGG